MQRERRKMPMEAIATDHSRPHTARQGLGWCAEGARGRVQKAFTCLPIASPSAQPRPAHRGFACRPPPPRRAPAGGPPLYAVLLRTYALRFFMFYWGVRHFLSMAARWVLAGGISQASRLRHLTVGAATLPHT